MRNKDRLEKGYMSLRETVSSRFQKRKILHLWIALFQERIDCSKAWKEDTVWEDGLSQNISVIGLRFYRRRGVYQWGWPTKERTYRYWHFCLKSSNRMQESSQRYLQFGGCMVSRLLHFYNWSKQNEHENWHFLLIYLPLQLRRRIFSHWTHL